MREFLHHKHKPSPHSDKMNNARNRAISVGSAALASLPRPHHVMRRSQSAVLGLTPRSVRIVVLGVGGVGKTAMSVRFVTKRFIGDYDPSLETIYRHTTVIDEQLVNFEIMDTAGQEDNSLMLEDKCKWGESFIFVYDVTDKYSFDELTRLKFIASYTHAKLRAHFTPVWILVGNKADLAERERMVSTEEGIALARELGCHGFREISVKESLDDSSEVFENLWREFSRLSPRSPSSSQRRKNSCRIQDKISILDSEACTCASETLKNISHHHHHSGENEVLVSTLTSTLKRQASTPALAFSNTRQCKHILFNDTNNNEDRFDVMRNIPCIPENIEEDDEEMENDLPAPTRERSRRNAIASAAIDLRLPSTPKFSRVKARSADNVSNQVDASSPSDSSMLMTSSSSASSSNTSLNSLVGSAPSSWSSKLSDFTRSRSSSDAALLNRKNNKNTNDLVSLYHDHCRRNRGRKCEVVRYNQNCATGVQTVGFSSTCEVRGY